MLYFSLQSGNQSPRLPQSTRSKVRFGLQNTAPPASNPCILGSQEIAKITDNLKLAQALYQLNYIENSPYDEFTLHKQGINTVFHSGKEALKVIADKHIRVAFGDMGETSAHAQWVPEQNQITINQKYRPDTSAATTLAMSEALYHEAGHAAGSGDGASSIQEELDCLALNTYAHRSNRTRFPAYANVASSSPLISNGVALYNRLFFEDPDPNKQALVNRVVEKYGDLPLSSPDHTPPPPSTNQPIPFAYRVSAQVQRNGVPSSVLNQGASASPQG